jgi:hypothetical protein
MNLDPGQFSDFIVYVDESGDHSLAKYDPEFPRRAAAGRCITVLSVVQAAPLRHIDFSSPSASAATASADTSSSLSTS